MKTALATAILSSALVLGTPASGAELKDMVGKWKWQDFIIEVDECPGRDVCSKVIAGPKSVGLEIFASKMTAKDGDWFAQVVHPQTGETYNTRMRLKDANHWRLDGCTASRVCLNGELVRVP